MTNFQKRKKFDLRKFINRTKNRFQRVRKFCRIHTLPVLVAVGIMVSVIFASYQNAYATGLEEYFYYTYFDLISGLFAETGVHFGLKDDYYTKSDRVSGKQVWDNFCTWVENKAKVAALPVEVVNKTVFDELKNLPNTVTSAGAKMSEKLSELLATVLPAIASDLMVGNDFVVTDSAQYNKMIQALTGCTDYANANSLGSSNIAGAIISGSALLSVVKCKNCYEIICCSPDAPFIDFNSEGELFIKGDWRSWSGGEDFISLAEKRIYIDMNTNSFASPQWIIKNGKFVASDGTSLSDYAKVKTKEKYPPDDIYVPGVGWKTNWNIWRDIILPNHVTTDEEEEAWNSRYNLDNDNKDDKEKKKKDNEKDKLPVAIPIVFPNKKPDSTEKDTEKDTESGVPGKDPSKNPMINPDTGRYIDPDTGYDIDPDTGKLIDPDTGELIEPDIPSTAGKAGNWKRLFPFCIPWDMMELIKSMQADKKAPVFEFKYTFKAVNYTWVVRVDMSDYWKYIKIFRWGMTIFFIIGLFFLTVKFTTFVQRMGG